MKVSRIVSFRQAEAGPHGETQPRFAALVHPYLTLARPANVMTAVADVLAGAAASGILIYDPAQMIRTLPWLVLATMGLYAGGVALNDLFDAEIDARERPERPIPSGRASRRGAALFGTLLLAGGVLAAGAAGPASFGIAAAIALAAVAYDRFAKHDPVAGPVTMALCRGGNLLLGVSIVPAMAVSLWYIALLPIAYIAAITMVSRGEVHGGGRTAAWLALALIGAVMAALLGLDLQPGYSSLAALPFVVIFAWRVLPPFWRAARDPTADRIRPAIKAGVLSQIVLDSALAAGFAGFVYGAVILALLPASVWLGRRFAVT